MTSKRVRNNRVVALVAAAALGTGAWLLYDGSTSVEHPPQPSAADAFDAPIPSSSPTEGTGARPKVPARAKVHPLAASVPVRVKIPAIGVDAPVTLLGLDSAGHLQVPDDTDRNLAGWYRNGPAPGTVGNAIIDGHVDTLQGPAVFYLLGSLHKGATVEVDLRDRRAAVFTVDAIEVYPKDAFPSKRVYGPTRDPELRVITCGGGYSRASGYLGNVVLYAHLTATRGSEKSSVRDPSRFLEFRT
ncbi:class F sortase [Streptacidiphilus sp. N1-10]|uniref:Class F sortase n=1 Tax=Streptacidiphilus jeojiensis TaxID=3229225 RepID=A0ABV6XF69_9ACTN